MALLPRDVEEGGCRLARCPGLVGRPFLVSKVLLALVLLTSSLFPIFVSPLFSTVGPQRTP
jgi:hypothetical protein